VKAEQADKLRAYAVVLLKRWFIDWQKEMYFHEWKEGTEYDIWHVAHFPKGDALGPFAVMIHELAETCGVWLQWSPIERGLVEVPLDTWKERHPL